MNLAIRRKALQVIPNISRHEWDKLDVVSKWFISTGAEVLIMTLISSMLAGLFAIRDHLFQPLPWLALTFGLLMAHASNNLFNDYTDYVRGVDQKSYYRALYGPRPLVDGLMTRSQNLAYFAVSASLALGSGLYLVRYDRYDTFIWTLIGLGTFFMLFYIWPLKYIAVGELAVVIVWGTLMIGGGYYVLAHTWDWNVVLATLPYALAVTTVIFGKHIDKIDGDQAKNIHTLPVLIGEKMSRYLVMGMVILQYSLLSYLVVAKYFTPLILFVLIAIPHLRTVFLALLNPKPAARPQDFPKGQGGWPLYFAPLAFWYNRSFGTLFIIGLIADTLLRIVIGPFQ